MKIFIALLFLQLPWTSFAFSDRAEVCKGQRSCISLNGLDRQLCEAYMEGRSCFSVLDKDERGWCEVMKDGKDCFMALNEKARQACEDERFPSAHLYWKACRDNKKVNL